jgi:DNA-binding NarL/FixJ family response regulator
MCAYGPTHELTKAQCQVIELAATGLSNVEIAQTLGRARSTVKHQMAAILAHYAVHDRHAAIEAWMEEQAQELEQKAAGL